MSMLWPALGPIQEKAKIIVDRNADVFGVNFTTGRAVGQFANHLWRLPISSCDYQAVLAIAN